MLARPARHPIRTGVRLVGVGTGADLDGPMARRRRAVAILETAADAEATGVDGFFLHPSVGLDPYPVLGAVAVRTATMTLGSLAEHARTRPPSMLAKVAASLDVLSGGRAVVGIVVETGEATLTPRAAKTAAGAAAPVTGVGDVDAVAGIADALEILRAMARVPAPSFRGTSWVVEAAWNEPRHAGTAPLPIAALLPARLLRDGGGALAESIALSARFAELCIVEVGTGTGTGTGTDPRRTHCRIELDAASRDAGRIPGEVELIALLGTDNERSSKELTSLASSWIDAGFDGVIVDVAVDELASGVLEETTHALGAIDR